MKILTMCRLIVLLIFSTAIPIQAEEGQYFSDKFDEGMRKIKSNGVYSKIMSSY